MNAATTFKIRNPQYIYIFGSFGGLHAWEKPRSILKQNEGPGLVDHF